MKSKNINLIVFNDYTTTYCAIANGGSLITYKHLANRQAGSHLVPTIASVFETAGYSLHDCSYIVAHRGPAPFTTLRAVITTVNGLSFASQIPLVGVDGMYVLAQQTDISKCDYILVLLNAFRKDVYYGLYTQTRTPVLYGWASFTAFMDMLSRYLAQYTYTMHIKCVGNAVHDYHAQLCEQTQFEPIVDQPITHHARIDEVAKVGEHQWKQRNINDMLTPLYLKKTQAHINP